MDENYLDNLLNEFSLDKEIDNKIEDELDEQIRHEKEEYQEGQTVSREESFNLDLENDAMDQTIDTDFSFSEDQIDELDRLDNLADLDMGNLDFSDIDFDDLDITKLTDDDLDSEFDDLLKDFEADLEIPSFSDESDIASDDKTDVADEVENAENAADVLEEPVQSEDDDAGEEAEGQTDATEDEPSEALPDTEDDGTDVDESESTEDLNEDNFDADSFLDSLLDDESESDKAEDTVSGDNEASDDSAADADDGEAQSDDSLDELLGDDEQNESAPASDDSLSEDDLFSMLELDESGSSDGDDASGPSDESSDKGSSYEGELDTSALEGLSDIEDISEKPKKKKRSFMEILFGPPDEDDEPTEEELQAIEAKKAAKKAKKEADAEKKKLKAEKDKADKSKKDADKKRAGEEKKRIKAEKKAKKKAAAEAEMAGAEPEKKLNKPMVIFIFSIFLGGVGFMYLSSVDFNYKLAIQHAANYFASQKYHKAYDEIKGVDVKEKDKELKDRIYTVMYVERLYEGYENNIELGRNKKALDSLLRGVEKYYEYYDEAQELDIVSDLDYSFSQIQNALQANYGITVERALEINDLDDYEYMKTVDEYTADMSAE